MKAYYFWPLSQSQIGPFYEIYQQVILLEDLFEYAK